MSRSDPADLPVGSAHCVPRRAWFIVQPPSRLPEKAHTFGLLAVPSLGAINISDVHKDVASADVDGS
jgi:hypothetical protein